MQTTHKNETGFIQRLMADDRLREQVVDQARKNREQETDVSLLDHILRVVAAIRRFLFGSPGNISVPPNDAQNLIEQNRVYLEDLVKSDNTSGEEFFVGEMVAHGKVDHDGEILYSVSLKGADGQMIALIGQELETAVLDAGLQIGENVFLSHSTSAAGSSIWTAKALRSSVDPIDDDDESDDTARMK